MPLPKALRTARAGYDYSAPSAPLGIYARGPANAPRDIPDAMRGNRSINNSTTAAAVEAIAAAAANSHKRRG
jgi:hypothetical protein